MLTAAGAVSIAVVIYRLYDTGGSPIGVADGVTSASLDADTVLAARSEVAPISCEAASGSAGVH